MAGSTITSSPVRLALPHWQPTGTTVHATNSWINAYVLPSREGGEEGREGPNTVSAFPPPAGQTPHQLPVLTMISAALILSLQKQQIPREDSFRAPPPAHIPPSLPRAAQRGTAAAIPHAHIYGCKQLRAGVLTV